MPKIDLDAVPLRKGSGYPLPFDAPCAERVRRRLGDAGGLRDFGVNLMTLPPGGWSSQRHWHSHEDEFVYVLQGELTLVEDAGETVLRAGDCAAFPKNSGNGHHLKNASTGIALYLEVGSRHPDDLTTCSDIDMMSSNADGRFVHKDGTPYGELPFVALTHGSLPMESQEVHRGRLIDHIQLVVRDLAASRAFYEAVFRALEIPMSGAGDDYFWADELFVSTKTSEAAQGNLTGRHHLAFQARDRAMVESFYQAALANGGTDNGAPGERSYHPGYYAAFVLDPDGNNIEAVYHGDATRTSASIRITF